MCYKQGTLEINSIWSLMRKETDMRGKKKKKANRQSYNDNCFLQTVEIILQTPGFQDASVVL